MKTLTAALLALVLLLLTTSPAFADGVLIKSRPDLDKDLREPAQKAIILHKDNTETLILQVKYEGEVDEFAWVIPVPAYPDVNVSEPLLFTELAYLTYKEYPLRDQNGFFECSQSMPAPGITLPVVDVWEEATVGVYDYAILSSTDPHALITWLNDNGYAFSEEGQGIVDNYIGKEWYFVAIKITATEVAQGLNKGKVQPLMLVFNSDSIVYPLEISSLSAEKCEILLYTFADRKVVPAEYPHLSLKTGEQIEYLSKGDNIFYLEYSDKILLKPRPIEYWESRFNFSTDSWKEQYSRELKYGYYDYSNQSYYNRSYYFLRDLLEGDKYHLTKMRADVTADRMVDINLVAYDEEDFPDTDGDGWSDAEEKVAGTNPHRVDTDYDGIVDSKDVSPNDIPPWALALIVVIWLGVLFTLWLLYRRRLFSRVPRFKPPQQG